MLWLLSSPLFVAPVGVVALEELILPEVVGRVDDAVVETDDRDPLKLLLKRRYLGCSTALSATALECEQSEYTVPSIARDRLDFAHQEVPEASPPC